MLSKKAIHQITRNITKEDLILVSFRVLSWIVLISRIQSHASGFQSGIFIDSSCQIGLVVFFRNFDGHVFAVVLDYGKDKWPKG